METLIEGGAWPGVHQGQTKKEGDAINLERQFFIVPTFAFSFLGLAALYLFPFLFLLLLRLLLLLLLFPPLPPYIYFCICVGLPFSLMKMKKIMSLVFLDNIIVSFDRYGVRIMCYDQIFIAEWREYAVHYNRDNIRH